MPVKVARPRSPPAARRLAAVAAALTLFLVPGCAGTGSSEHEPDPFTVSVTPPRLAPPVGATSTWRRS